MTSDGNQVSLPGTGTKLNVKSFLAGKLGVCFGNAGTKVRIPVVSRLVSSMASWKKPTRCAFGQAMAPARGHHARRPGVSAATATPTQGTATADDPIAEAPAAIWYVRPPTGGQYGPARGDVMRKWISEGRVSSDSLVWREGWTDWQNAGKLFPTLPSREGAFAAALPFLLPSRPPFLSRRSRARAPPFATRRRNAIPAAWRLPFWLVWESCAWCSWPSWFTC